MKINFNPNNGESNHLLIKLTIFVCFFIYKINGEWTPLSWQEEKTEICIPDKIISPCWTEGDKITPQKYIYTQAWACCNQDDSCTKYSLENNVNKHVQQNRREGQLLLEASRQLSHKVCCDKKEKLFSIKEQWILWLKGHHACKLHPLQCSSKVHAIICDPEYCFRTITGHCNNLEDKSLGAAEEPFARKIPACYSDGIHNPRLTRKGTLLKNPRDISLSIARAYKKTIGLKMKECEVHPNVLLTGINLLILYDVSNTISYIPKDDKHYKENCCSCNESCIVSDYMNGYACLPMKVSEKDKYFGKDNCLHYGRSAVVPNKHCSLGPAEQACTVTHFMDLSFLYGSTSEVNHHIRCKTSGYIALDEHKLFPVCCDGNSYLTGDARVTNWPQAAIIASMLYKEHNCLVDKLRSVNAKWNGETLYQLAKKILTALWQKIVFNELIPTLLGEEMAKKYNLSCEIGTDCHCYDKKIDPRTLNEMGNAVSIYFKLWIPNRIWSRHGKSFKKVKLYEVFDNVQYCESNFDALLNGILNQPLERDSFAKSIHNFKHDGISRDELAWGIITGRDHGIAPYVDYIKLLHGVEINCWEHLHKFISPENCKVLKKNYKSYKDIDLLIGVLLEEHTGKLPLSPTVALLVAHQVHAMKCGDRYHYTSKTEFTKEQRKEIDKFSLASLICIYGNSKEVPENPLLIPSDKNPWIPCDKVHKININVFKNSKF